MMYLTVRILSPPNISLLRFLLRRSSPETGSGDFYMKSDFLQEKSEFLAHLFHMVAGTGLEPVWETHSILSRTRIPIPPPGHVYYFNIFPIEMEA